MTVGPKDCSHRINPQVLRYTIRQAASDTSLGFSKCLFLNKVFMTEKHEVADEKAKLEVKHEVVDAKARPENNPAPVAQREKLSLRKLLTSRPAGDISIMMVVTIIQIVSAVLLYRSRSLGELALVTTVANSLCQAAIDFYQNKKGKSYLSAGIRVIGILIMVLIYLAVTRHHLTMADKI